VGVTVPPPIVVCPSCRQALVCLAGERELCDRCRAVIWRLLELLRGAEQ
jgi:Zn-dependent alcohol dehydrogenase